MEFILTSDTTPSAGYYYLVKVPYWCESGYAIAIWDGHHWLDEGQASGIDVFVTEYCPVILD